MKTFLLMTLTFLSMTVAKAQSRCGDFFGNSKQSIENTIVQLKSNFEAKLDPENSKYSDMGWGKTEGKKVREFKQKMFEEEDLYDSLFLPAKFNLAKLENFEGVANREGQVELLRFFGESLRMMTEKQMADQFHQILNIANNISMGDGFLNSLNATVIAGKREFVWFIRGGTVSVQISDYQAPNLGW